MDKTKKKVITILGAVVGIIIVACIIFIGTGNLRKYNKAEALLESGKYEDARKIFTELNDYKDSENQVLECDYQTSLQLIESEKYSDAKIILTHLYDDVGVKSPLVP